MLPGELTDIECRIETGRLVLRRYRTDDKNRLVSLANNWNVARQLSRMPHPYTEADAVSFLSRQADAGGAADSLTLAVTLDDALVGGISLFPHSGAGLELGYWLAEPYWNRGYMSEAALALRDFGFRRLGLPVIIAGHYADNHASGRILTKLGFRYTRESLRMNVARGEQVRCLDMEMSRASWLSVAGQREDAAVA